MAYKVSLYNECPSSVWQKPAYIFYVSNDISDTEFKRIGFLLQQIKPDCKPGAEPYVYYYNRDRNNCQLVIQYPEENFESARGKVAKVKKFRVSVANSTIPPAATASIDKVSFLKTNIEYNSELDFTVVDSGLMQKLFDKPIVKQPLNLSLAERIDENAPKNFCLLPSFVNQVLDPLESCKEELKELAEAIRADIRRLEYLKKSAIQQQEEAIELDSKLFWKRFVENDLTALENEIHKDEENYRALQVEYSQPKLLSDEESEKIAQANVDKITFHSRQVEPTRVELINALQLTAVEYYRTLLYERSEKLSSEDIALYNKKLSGIAQICQLKIGLDVNEYQLNFPTHFMETSIEEIKTLINNCFECCYANKSRIKWGSTCSNMLLKRLNALSNEAKSQFSLNLKINSHFAWNELFIEKSKPLDSVYDGSSIGRISALVTQLEANVREKSQKKMDTERQIDNTAKKAEQHVRDIERRKAAIAQAQNHARLQLVSINNQIAKASESCEAIEIEMVEYKRKIKEINKVKKQKKERTIDVPDAEVWNKLVELKAKRGELSVLEATITHLKSQIEEVKTTEAANNLKIAVDQFNNDFEPKANAFNAKKLEVTQLHKQYKEKCKEKVRGIEHEKLVVGAIKKILVALNDVEYWNTKVTLTSSAKLKNSKGQYVSVPKGIFDMNTKLSAYNSQNIDPSQVEQILSILKTEASDALGRSGCRACFFQVRKSETTFFYTVLSNLAESTMPAAIDSQFKKLKEDWVNSLVAVDKPEPPRPASPTVTTPSLSHSE